MSHDDETTTPTTPTRTANTGISSPVRMKKEKQTTEALKPFFQNELLQGDFECETVQQQMPQDHPARM